MPFDGIVTKAITEELQEQLIKGKLNKIHQPTNTELVLTIRNNRENHVLLLSIHPMYARIHLTEDTYQNPKEPPMFCMVLRKHLYGAILESIEQISMERIILFKFRARNEIGDISYKTLVVEIMGRHSHTMLIDPETNNIIDTMKHIPMSQNRYRTIMPGSKYKLPPQQDKLNPLEIDDESFIKRLDFNGGKMERQIVGQLTGVSPFIAKELVFQAGLGSSDNFRNVFQTFQEKITKQKYEPAIYQTPKEDFHVLPITAFNQCKTDFSSISNMLDSFYSGKAERDRVNQQARDLSRFIKNELDKNERKMKKHNQTLQKAKNATKYQKYGELLTAHMHLASKGDKTITVVDYYDPEQKELTIPLDPNKTPNENAQNFFKRYRKLSTSKKVIEKEMIKTKAEIAYFEQLLQQIDSARVEDVEEIRDELRDEGYLKRRRKQNKKKTIKPKPEMYQSAGGEIILVGKNNRQNEYLTMKIAHRDDVWLHTKDIPGSHVVIRSKNPSEKTLIDAAKLAAYFSKAKDSSSVPVDYTNIRHVRKPNGAKPGFVTYDNQKTLFVTPSESIVKQLKTK